MANQRKTTKREKAASVLLIPVNRIRSSPDQPRTHFDLGGLKRLAKSIEERGLRHPIEVRKVEGDPNYDYEIIDGERRWRAHRMLNLEFIKAFVNELVTDAEDQFECSAVSNVCREDLSHIELARAMGRIRKRRSAEEIANLFGCTNAWVYQCLNLLRLAPEVQALMELSIPERKRLSMSAAYYISVRIPQNEQRLQIETAREIVDRELRIAPAKRLIDERSKGLGTAPKPRRLPHLKERFQILTGFVEKLDRELEEFLNIPTERLHSMFLGRHPRTGPIMTQSLETAINRLHVLRKRILEITHR